MAEKQCDGLDKPAAVQQCRAPVPCSVKPSAAATYRWKTSPWSACSASCGPGVQNRRVSCRLHHGGGGKESSLRNNKDTVAEDARCQVAVGRTPATQRACVHQPPCASVTSVAAVASADEATDYGWLPDDWRDCSHTCGKKGRQVRRVFCYQKRSGKIVHRRQCDRATRPPRKRKCNQRRCVGHGSCAEILQKQPAAADKEYVLNILDRDVSVYCHGMRSGKPTEYLTLPRDNENYSEIYDQRLKDPATCPFNGERRQNCPCDNVPVPSSGLTVFQKIRLNVTSMRVDTKDYTFTKQIKGKPVPFGEAGDCYSNSKSGCPQGRFSIDLTKTGMRVSYGTTWVGKGSDASFWVNKINAVTNGDPDI
ncbi:Hypothetical protein CINCED_3A024376 [Cinara cedri]|uniref:GON domain-containing protein n=1 Tax=Cinara cedri TaxID=506608 RepID=A0A5E4MS93_9HEMI|nr:Hypothetical protein CINCED_3A024376 [Cinara cedri]